METGCIVSFIVNALCPQLEAPPIKFKGLGYEGSLYISAEEFDRLYDN